jgi:general nucleoside transport system ATP-binding protein
MVGEEVKAPVVARQQTGSVLFELNNVTTPALPGIPALKNMSLSLRAGEITGLAGVSGNGQAALAGMIAGTLVPQAGTIFVAGTAQSSSWSPQTALSRKIGRIPEDRHAEGMIGDMNVTENVISERYRTSRFSRLGFINWHNARKFAQDIITHYDVKCPSPEAAVRLLSGGNMQKLILGRALDGNPDVVLANQPTRGLDVGAVAYVHARLLEARARGAAIFLISEDLDEIMALSDRIFVISHGRLSQSSERGQRSLRELGELMAGHGFDHGDKPHAA